LENKLNFFKVACEDLQFNVSAGKETVRYGIVQDGNFVGLKYFEVDSITKNKALSLIPDKYRCHFDVSYLVINTGNVWPHTDSDIEISINIYLKPSNCETIFYKQVDTTSGIKIKNQTNGNIFNAKDLTVVDSFVAKKDEVWALDVTTIHSVQNEKFLNTDLREVIVVQSNTIDFKTMYKVFKNYGKIADC